MFFRLLLFTAIHFVSILLPAQSIGQLAVTPHSISDRQSVPGDRSGQQDVIEQKCLVLAGEIPTSHNLQEADLRPVSHGEVVEHSYFTLAYSEQNEQACWVYYKLTGEMLNGVASRTGNFKPDNKVSTLSAHPDDYTGTGYDRGHLCPAADMTINPTAMAESFYMSNMSPQTPAFNRGIWKKLEATVRHWASVEKEIHIVTGPVFKDNLGKLPHAGVTVPGYFYKVVYDPTDEPKMIALVLPNAPGEKQLNEYVVTVNYVEFLTGIDFFAALPDDLENRLEAGSDASLWEFKEYKGPPADEKTPVQCQALAKSTGQRCRNTTTNTNGFCHRHQP